MSVFEKFRINVLLTFKNIPNGISRGFRYFLLFIYLRYLSSVSHEVQYGIDIKWSVIRHPYHIGV